MMRLCRQAVFVKQMKLRSESILENDLWVDGCFMTEKDMNDNDIPASLAC